MHKHKILQTKLENPTWGYKKIAKAIGCTPGTVQYHLRADYRVSKAADSRRRRHKYKAKLVALAGGKCQLCGYAKSLAALQFHHRDPDKKLSAVTRLSNYKLMLKELKKCDLLCANCHLELTYPVRVTK